MTPQELEARLAEVARLEREPECDYDAAQCTRASLAEDLLPALLDLWRAAERSSTAFFDSEVYHARQALSAALARLREVRL